MTAEDIFVRPARTGDAATIAAIHIESWRDAYAGVLDPAYLAAPVESDRRAVWADRFANPVPAQTVLVAEAANGEAVGFVCFYRDRDEHWGSLIDNLHVRPALRGKAIGKMLLQAAVAELDPAKPFHLWVFEANAGAVRFYQRLGGKAVERIPDDMPAARGAPILRMVWADARTLADRD